MQEIDDLWSRVVAGDVPAQFQPHEERALITRVERAVHAEVAADRIAAMRVALAIGGREAIGALVRFARDPDLTVRRALFEHAFALRDDGLTIFRELAGDPDLDLALAALGLLRRAVDRAATGRLRVLLTSPMAPVRAAAVELLGHVGGPTVKTEVEKRLGDDDDAVRREAEAALARIAGKLPRAVPERWYPEPTALAPTEPAAPRKKILVPGRKPPPDRAAAEALLRRLGAASPADRPAFLDELIACGAPALGAAALAFRGGDPELGRGIAFAAALQDLGAWATVLRRNLGDPAAGVREASAQALGQIGKGAALVPALAPLLTDPEARVRVAAIDAMAALCGRLGRPELLRQRLAAVEKDADEGVQAARARALKTP